jgi:hypothetical protein
MVSIHTLTVINTTQPKKGENMVDFIKARLAERTSWDGIAICGMSLLVICAAPLVKLLAWPALVYGLWTIYSEE